MFDASAFRISAAEASSMDPQQRLLLEYAELLCGAGYDRSSLEGGWGVCGYRNGASESMSSRKVRSVYSNGLLIRSGGSRFIRVRFRALFCVRYRMLRIIGLHAAVRALQDGDCDTALVMGVMVMLTPGSSTAMAAAGMTSPTGNCHTFDASADGFCTGEGIGAIVLRRSDDAKADQQPMHAMVRGVSVKQDGISASLTAPNGRAQEKLLRATLRDAGLAGEDVDYVEAHGTGTALGDPIEMGALAAVMGGEDRDEESPLVMGSAKANIGHLEPAAGIAGVIKAILVLQHEQAPPNPALKTLNPKIAAVTQDMAVRFPTCLEALRPYSSKGLDEALVAGVSSFGYAGTIAHALLGQAPVELARAAPTLESDAALGAGLLCNRRSFPWGAAPHPLLQRREMIDQDTTAYHAVFHESLMELMGDHTIGGRTILPGAGFVEMALAVAVEEHRTDMAGAAQSTSGGVELVGVSFLEPLDLAKATKGGSFEATHLECEATADGGMVFQYGNGDKEGAHATVKEAHRLTLRNVSDESTSEVAAGAPSLAIVQERCTEEVKGLAERYTTLAEEFGMHGPHPDADTGRRSSATPST